MKYIIIPNFSWYKYTFYFILFKAEEIEEEEAEGEKILTLDDFRKKALEKLDV